MRRLPRLGLLLVFVALACACGGGGSTSTSGPLPAGPTAPATASATATPTAHASATPSASPHPSTSPTASPSASPAATNGPALTINVATGRQAISNDIYGVTIFWTSSLSSTYNTFAAAIRLPANRYGGDATTRYNWQVDSSNAGSDWYFMAGNGQSSVTPGASVDYIVNVNKGLGTKSIITVPIIDYINKQAATNCSYPDPPVANQVPFNGNPAYNPYVTLDGGTVKCGSGSNAAGYINDTTPTATDVANTPAIQQAWVTHMVSKWGQGASGGVPIYELDNEPNGWIAVHHDIRPQNIGYHELFNKSLAMAKAIKAADPTALVLGPDDIPPADEGCNNGNPSNVSTGTCNNDGASQNGNTPLGLWYLQQFATQSPRMLDYYAMHYPGACCFATNGTLADMVTAIQRHKGWIASAYPGTKLAYDEWNRGTGNTFAVSLATADGLGVMGQQGVDLASFWGLDPSYPSAYAFLMFRNYDGHGSGFGETSVTATSADTTKLTVYAAQRSADNAVTIIVVNSTSSAWTSAVSLSGVTMQQKAPTYQYTSASASAIVAGSTITPNGSTLVVTFPANSITMIVQPSGSQALSSRRR